MGFFAPASFDGPVLSRPSLKVVSSLRCFLPPLSATMFGRMLIRWKRALFLGSYICRTPRKGSHNPRISPRFLLAVTCVALVAIDCFTTDSAPFLGTEEQLDELDIFDHICTSRERWRDESAVASETGKTWWMKRECIEILLLYYCCLYYSVLL